MNTALKDADEARLIELVPAEATAKGLYIEAVFDQLRAAGLERPTPQRYFAFKDYPLTVLMRFLLDAAPRRFPDCTLHESLQRFGRDVYPTLAATTAGKVIFSVAGTSFARVKGLPSESQSRSGPACRARSGESNA
jgi:uncharacterized protein (TIGR02265 family)